jgi:hypothetical protein
VCALSRALSRCRYLALYVPACSICSNTHTPRALSPSLSRSLCLAAHLQRLAAPSRPFPARAGAMLRLPVCLARPNVIANSLNTGWLTCGGSRASLFRGHRPAPLLRFAKTNSTLTTSHPRPVGLTNATLDCAQAFERLRACSAPLRLARTFVGRNAGHFIRPVDECHELFYFFGFFWDTVIK